MRDVVDYHQDRFDYRACDMFLQHADDQPWPDRTVERKQVLSPR